METAADQRIKLRVKTPYEQIIHLFKTKDYTQDIKEHNDILKKIASNPVESYYNMYNRLKKYGPTAEFKEFKGVISFLTRAIFQTEENVKTIEKDDTLKNIVELLTHSLIAIQISTRYIYPYKATILVIDEMLKILDIIARKHAREKNKPLSPYYHNMRYRVYLTYLLDDITNENIVFPTCANIGSTILIQLRCVPIQILGVVDKAVHADQYLNSPIDFFSHDIQHARRLVQENDRYYDIIEKHKKYYVSRSPFDLITKEKFYNDMHEFTLKLLDFIKKNESDTDEQKAYKQIQRMLIFEVVHEKAWPITKFSLCRNIPLGYDIFPIENLEVTNDNIHTRDDKFEDPTTLSNLYHKLRHGFYDDPENPSDIIVNPKFRTATHIANATQQLLTSINCTNTTDIDKLIALSIDKKNATEFTESESIHIKEEEFTKKIKDIKIETMPFWQVEIEAPLIKNKDELDKKELDKKESDREKSDKVKNKYIKYKNKYIKLKNNM